MRSFRQTTGMRNPSAKGRAMVEGTGVTRWIHRELSLGVNTGTGKMMRGMSPATSA